MRAQIWNNSFGRGFKYNWSWNTVVTIDEQITFFFSVFQKNWSHDFAPLQVWTTVFSWVEIQDSCLVFLNFVFQERMCFSNTIMSQTVSLGVRGKVERKREKLATVLSLLDKYELMCQTSQVFVVTVFIKISSKHFCDPSNPLFHQPLKVDFKSMSY